MLYKVFLLLSLSQTISRSLVVDNKAQIHLRDYCPKMKFCAEGTHVMCMYYDPKNIMGPHCSNAVNISLTPELVNKLVDVTNAVRAQIAKGEAKGKNGELLPRGYGVFKLSWDSELATFAQVLANQCMMRFDLCRATSKFPDPGQIAGLVRFTYPDWLSIPSSTSKFTTPGLTADKLLFATTHILKSWFVMKRDVTPYNITMYPDWSRNPFNQNSKLYLEMIYGSSTHMGCGISAYTQYAFHDDKTSLTYNVIQVMCNYSGRPQKGTAVYNTVPPGVASSRCGCPVGSEPDDDCLCSEIHAELQHPKEMLKQPSRVCPDGETCDPAVVVLPIFTVEDAPPEKLLTRPSYTNASLRQQMSGTDSIFHRIENNVMNSKNNNYNDLDNILNRPKARFYSKLNAVKKQPREGLNNRISSHYQKVRIRDRYFDKKHMESKMAANRQTRGNAARKKTSLFSRAAKFELPGAPILHPIKDKRKTVAFKDVVARKDFSNAKQLVNKFYLYGQNKLVEPDHKKKPNVVQNKTFDEHKPPNVDHYIEHTNVEQETSIDDLYEKNKQPMDRKIIQDKITTFSENEQPKANIRNTHNIVTQHDTFGNTIDNEHHLLEVFNILNESQLIQNSEDNVKYKNIPDTENAVQKNITHNALTKQILSNANSLSNRLNSVTDETDSKLMSLLDTLEQEVKHVELRDKNKQLFDAKIRKIYGKIVGKTASLTDLNALQKRYNVHENSNEVIGRKLYNYDDFNRNKNNQQYKDEPRQRLIETETKYRGRNNEGVPYYRDDEAKHRNVNHVVDYGRNKVDLRRNDDTDQRIRKNNYYISNDAGRDEALSFERRRFYQDKLENLERQIQMRKFKRRKDNPQQMRPMRPATRKTENQMNLYGRARYDRGY